MTNSIAVNIDDYLSDSDKKQIATEAFREACQARAHKDFERILSNSAYALVGAEVDKALDGSMVDTIKSKAIEVINSLSSHTVFSPPNAWDREASQGWKHLQLAVNNSSDQIKARVAEVIAEYNSSDLRGLLEDRLVDAIIQKIKE